MRFIGPKKKIFFNSFNSNLIMPNLEVISVGQTPPTSMLLLLALMFEAVGGSSPAPLPLASPQFLQFQPEVVAEQQPPQLETVAQPIMEEEDDYGIWNPAPYAGGGGGGAPIPHTNAACCPHLPCCSHFQLSSAHYYT